MDEIIIKINRTEGKIMSNLTFDQLAIISSECSFEVEGAEFKRNTFRKKSGGKNDWDGRRRLFNINTRRFPIGLLPRITNIFSMARIPVRVEGYVGPSARSVDINSVATNFEERPYQTEAINKSIEYGSGIIKAATGAGKTTIAARTIAELGKPTVFIVHTKDLLYQAKESFEKLLDCPIGQIGDGIIDLDAPVVVATVQSLALANTNVEYEKYGYDEDADDGKEDISEDKGAIIREWSRGIKVVQFDEVQRVASRTAYSARFMFPNAEHAFGYSASPWRDDGADLMIEGAFGPIIYDISASKLIRDGYLVKPRIMVKTIKSNVWSGDNYSMIYRTAIVENMFRNIQVVQDAIDHYNHGRCTLILITQIKHGKIIESMIKSTGLPAQFISGKSNMKYRKQVIEDMRNGKAPIVIASTIADVGLDVPRIGAIVEAGAGKSSVTALQRLGRIMRKFPGKDDCYFTTYRDNVPIIYRHIDRKIEIWKTEPEFDIIEVE